MVVVWQLALDIIQDVRGTLAMYLFIIEESIQTLGMAIYQAKKSNRTDLVRELAQYTLDNVITPAIAFCNTYGMATYPLNQAYWIFYDSSKKLMETYLAE